MASSQHTAFRKATVSTHRLSRHNLGSEHVTTASFGQIIPIYCAPMAPGSTFHYEPKIYLRTPALAQATFGNIRVKQYSFFVPCRLLWDKWNDFVAQGFEYSFSMPSVQLGKLGALSLTEEISSPGSFWNSNFASLFSQTLELYIRDKEQGIGQKMFPRGTYTALSSNLGLNLYAGLELPSEASIQDLHLLAAEEFHDILPFRAYQQIWWDWFRDSVLVPDTAKGQYIFTDSGDQLVDLDYNDPDDRYFFGSRTEQFRVRQACYSKDYFTTAKKSPQYGDSIPLVPVNVGVDVNENIKATYVNSPGIGYSNKEGNIIPTVASSYELLNNTSDPSDEGNTNIGQFSINTFRYYNALQEYLEQLNVGGTRAIEVLLAQYGVVADAVREDMAEFVGGEDRILDIVMVTQTAETSEGSLGDNSAYGKVYLEGGTQSYSAKEFGIFMSVMYLEPVTGYCDGVPAVFDWLDREDWFMEKFENTGYDAIPIRRLFRPLYVELGVITPDDLGQAFGFQPRYSDWKFQRDVLAGDFVRPDTSVGADSFHTFRRFFDSPSLNSAFTQINLKSYGNNWNRLFVNTLDTYDPFYINVTNENNAVLPMEGFASPALSAVYADSGKKVSIPYGGVRL